MECTRGCYRPFLGSFYAFLAALAICLWGLTFKFISSPSGLHATLSRLSVFYFVSLPIATYKLMWLKKPSKILSLKNYCYLFMDALSGVGCVLFTAKALEYSSIGDVYAIGSSYMIPMLLISYFFLNEKPHWTEILLAILSVVGVLFIAKPSFLFDAGTVYDLPQIKGLLYACGVCITIAIRIASDKKVLEFSSNTDISLWTGAMGTIVTLLIMWTTKSGLFLPCLKDFMWLLIGALLAVLSRLLLFLAVKIEKANRVAMIYCMQILIGFMFDSIYTRAPPNYISVIGGVIIVFSSVVSLFLKVYLFR